MISPGASGGDGLPGREGRVRLARFEIASVSPVFNRAEDLRSPFVSVSTHEVHSMDDLLLGVIGSGGRGALALEAHRPGKGARVVACCDSRPEALEANRRDYGADLFTTADYRELLARRLDAVFVTAPDFLHEEMAIAALEAGKAVYLEKPMAITVDGCDRILRVAARTGRRLYLGHNMRHFLVIETMKSIIDSGRIGNVKTAWCRHFVSYGGDAYFKDWHSERKNVTGLLLQKGAHDIDVLHWLCGGYSRRVTALGSLMVYGQVTDRRERPRPDLGGFDNTHWPPLAQKQLSPVIDVEDVSLMLMQLDNGVLASYQQCHFTPDGWRNYTIIGDCGRIENLNDSGDSIIRVWNRRKDGYRAEGDEDVILKPETGSHGGADPKIVDEFLRYVREGGRTNTSPIAGREAVAAGYTATQSLRQGGMALDVPALDPEVAKHFG